MLLKFLSEIKSICRISIPFILMLLAQKFLQVFSAIMMGFHGAYALAAGILASAFYLFFTIFGIGILNMSGIFIARAFGAKNKLQIGVNIFNSFIVAFITIIPIFFIIWHLPILYQYIGINPHTVEITETFLHAVVWGFPAILFFAVLREFLAAINHQRIVTHVVLAAVPVNILINLGFFYEKFGLPSLSIDEIGYAHAITEWFMFITLYGYILKNKSLNMYIKTQATQKISFNFIKEIFRLGIPNGFSLSFQVIISAFLTLMISYFGTYSLAAHQIAFQSVNTLYMIPLGLSLASSLRVSQFIGSRNYPAAMTTMKTTIMITISFAVFLMPLFLFFPDLFISLFINTTQPGYEMIRRIAKGYLMIGAFFLCFEGLQIIISGFLRVFKDTFVAMIISAFSYLIVALGGGYFLAFELDLKGLGLWLGLAGGLACSALFLSVRLTKDMKKIISEN